MAEVKTGGDVRPGEFQFILHPKEYLEAGISPVTSKDRDQPYEYGLVTLEYKDDGVIIIHGHPYVGGLYGVMLEELIGRKVYERVWEIARPTLKSYVHAGRNAGNVDLTVRELRHILRGLHLMEPLS